MKKIYFLFLSFALCFTFSNASAKSDISFTGADTWYYFWFCTDGCGSIEVYSDAAHTDKIVEDFGSADGVDIDLQLSTFPNGMFMVLTPNEGFELDNVIINDKTFFYDVVDNCVNVKIEDIPEAEDGIMVSVFFIEQKLGAISEIGVDFCGEVEYYNLQGIRVAVENLSNGIYVARQGDKASKILIRK